MIKAFLLRRWWLTQNRVLATVTSTLILPLILHIALVTVMSNIIVRSIDGIAYPLWVFPGLLMILAMVGMLPLVYRDFFDLRIYRRTLWPLTMTPLTKPEIVVGIVVTALLETVLYVIIGGCVLAILNSIVLPWYQYFYLLGYVLLFSLLVVNALITIALLTSRVTTNMFISMSVFLFILFGSGILTEFEFFPPTLGLILSHLPTGLLMTGLRALLFTGVFDLLSFVIPAVVSLVWLAWNGNLLKHILKQ